MRYVSNSLAAANVQDTGRITFSEGINTRFTKVSSMTILFFAEYLSPKPKNKYF